MLDIDRLSINVRSAVTPECSERLARRLRDAAVKGVERGHFFPDWASTYGHAFVERLAVHCLVSSEWDDAVIGAEVAKSLAAALERSLEAPSALAFRDRAELLAAFYAELAEGRAWDRWWLEGFDGLKALSSSAALRTSVINEDARGLAALARLTQSVLSKVLGLLTSGDTRRLLEWLAQRPASAKAALLPLWNASASLPSGDETDMRWLSALIGAERGVPGGANGDTLLTLRAMSGLRAAAARGSVPVGMLLAEPHQEALRQILVALSLPSRWCDRLEDTEARAIVEALREPSTRARPSMPGGTRENAFATSASMFTRNGGAFVLLKALDWLGWPQQWSRGSASADATALARALAFLVVGRALDPEDTAPILHDSALRSVFGVEEPIAFLRNRRRDAAIALRSEGNGATPSRLGQRLLDELAKRIPGLAGASSGYLRRNLLALPATLVWRSDHIEVRLGRAPLDVLLVLAGAKSGRVTLPGGAVLQLDRDTAG